MQEDRWQEVERLYRSVLDRPPESRADFLRDACPDAAVRREVESLLRHHGDRPAVAWPESQNLPEGASLGPYEILGIIGSGGMGTVYRARDTRLGRAVAVKVCHEQLSGRFQREARAIAALNHPHICTLYDIGTQDGVDYLVMEYLSGQTLSARLAEGPLPVDQAIQIARKIGAALDYAHRAGLAHRDVKPANILLTGNGAKLLDFGIAKSTHTPGLDQTNPTATMEGVLVGTPQYMAPEQLEGKEADARSDVWAWGAVLYEMVSGRRPFHGDSIAALSASVLSSEPPPLDAKPFTPPALDRVVKRCLQKDPENRWQSIRDAALELHPLSPDVLVLPPPRRRSALWILASLCALFAAAAGWEWRRPATPTQPMSLEVTAPEGTHFSPVTPGGGSAISPDGRTLAFAATAPNGESRLCVRSMETGAVRALGGTDDPGRPFWSPDSKSIGYMSGGKLKRVDVATGTVTTLCDANAARGGTWNEDGIILFATPEIGLQRVSATGGTPVAVTSVNQQVGELVHYYPQFLPGGKTFLYLVRFKEPEKMGISVGSLDGRPPVRVQQTEYKALYDAGSGKLLYIVGAGTLMARSMRLNPPEVRGDPEIVAEGIRLRAVNGYSEFSLSDNGMLVFGRETESTVGRFAWHDRFGKILETVGQPVEAVSYPRLSPDGKRVAYNSDAPGKSGIWILDLARGLNTRITSHLERSPQWSPDGARLYYASFSGICSKASDGSGEEEVVFHSSPNEFVTAVSPDNRNLLFGAADIQVLPLTGERKPSPYLKANYSALSGQFSPDGKWLAYQSNESGQYEIYVQGFPEHRGKRLVSAGGGINPHWREDGKELYWVRRDDTLMTASVQLGIGQVTIGPAQALFRLTVGTGYVPSPEGRQFLTFEPKTGARPNGSMVVQLNWALRLKR